MYLFSLAVIKFITQVYLIQKSSKIKKSMEIHI